MATAFDSYCEQAIGSQQAQFGAGIYQGLMRMWHGVLFGTLVWEFSDGDTPESLLTEKLAADAGFEANIEQCLPIVESLQSQQVRDELQAEAANGRVPRVVVLTTRLANIFEPDRAAAANRDTAERYEGVGRMFFTFALLLRRDSPECVSLLTSEFRRR
jgi:hypothetical protein